MNDARAWKEAGRVIGIAVAVAVPLCIAVGAVTYALMVAVGMAE